MVNIDSNDFIEAIEELGEEITLNPGEPNECKLHASLKPNMLNKAIGTTDGAYWITGVMTFKDMQQQEESAGAYFKRSTQPNVTCMVYALFPENSTSKLAISHCVECNEKIDIVSHYEETGEVNKFGERVKRPVIAFKDVDAYITTFTKDAQDTSAGAFKRTSSYLMIPAKYTLSSQNRVLRTSFVYDEKTHSNVIGKVPYKIESLDTTMVDVVNGKLVGLIKCLLKEAQEE